MKHLKKFNREVSILERFTDIRTEPNGQKTFQIPDQGLYVIYEESTNSMTIKEVSYANQNNNPNSIKINDVKNFIQKLNEL